MSRVQPNRAAAFVLLALAALVAMPGCQLINGANGKPSALKGTAAAFEVYTGIESALIIEQKAGHLTADQHKAITPKRDAARAALDAASKAAIAGDETAMQAAFSAARAAVDAYAKSAYRATGGRVNTLGPPSP